MHKRIHHYKLARFIVYPDRSKGVETRHGGTGLRDLVETACRGLFRSENADAKYKFRVEAACYFRLPLWYSIQVIMRRLSAPKP